MDLEKSYISYFLPRLADGSTKVLLHNVFFGLLFYTGRLGKEALPSLCHDAFTMKCSLNAKTFVEIVFNEANKNFTSAIHLLPMTPAVADLGFPRGGAPTPKGGRQPII